VPASASIEKAMAMVNANLAGQVFEVAERRGGTGNNRCGQLFCSAHEFLTMTSRLLRKPLSRNV